MKARRLLVLAACLGVFVGMAHARAIDDARFIMDIRGDLNGNGRIDANEVGNKLDAGADAPTQVNMRMSAAAAVPPNCTNLFIAPPIHPMTTNWTKCVYFTQSDYYDADGWDHVTSDRVDFLNAAVKGSDTQTAFIRFKWEGSSVTNFQSNCWLFLNGYNWNPKSGWGVYIAQVAGKDGEKSGTLGFMIPTYVSSSGGKTVYKNEWYDLFVTVKPNGEANSLFKYWLFRTPSSQIMADENNRLTFDVPGMVTGTIQNATIPKLLFGDAYKNIRIGCESDSYSNYAIVNTANVNAAKNFRGAINQLMFWNRELTENEMNEIRTGYSGAVISAGAINGSADEFSDTNPAEVFNPTNEWISLRKTLTEEHPSITLKGKLPKGAAGRGHVLAITPIFSGASALRCPVRVEVNGTNVGTLDLKRREGRNIYIPGKFMQRDGDGIVTVTITRIDPFSETLQLDAVVLGGSWCVGVFDNTHAELERESCVARDFVVGDPDFKHTMRALQSELYGRLLETRIHAYYPCEGVNRCDGVFRVRLLTHASGTVNNVPWKLNGHGKIDLWLNGGRIAQLTNTSSGDMYEIPISREDLVPGMNVFSLSNAVSKADLQSIGAKSGWICFDAMAFELNPPPNGTMLILR